MRTARTLEGQRPILYPSKTLTLRNKPEGRLDWKFLGAWKIRNNDDGHNVLGKIRMQNKEGHVHRKVIFKQKIRDRRVFEDEVERVKQQS